MSQTEKESKAAPVFWAVLACLGEAMIVIGSILGAILASPMVLLFALVPGAIIGFVIFFLLQSLKEIDERETRREEWKKY